MDEVQRLQLALANSKASFLDETYRAVLAILDSPAWLVTISTFIEAECLIFDGVELINDAHALVFERFTKLVDGLLEEGLAERRVSKQELARLCCIASSHPTGQQVLEQLLALEDIRLFAGMMVRCNKRLHLKAKGGHRSKGNSMGKEDPAGANGNASCDDSGALCGPADDLAEFVGRPLVSFEEAVQFEVHASEAEAAHDYPQEVIELRKARPFSEVLAVEIKRMREKEV
ncbi:hypothetical protein AB1Y20_019548 [Prymnesium parvum]|uniref:Cilia- and flagella-associated protein 36 n=1 Tax=Prymnesium parvum TaxID=97485 RepID=A0AB34JUG2_PRYPA